MEHIEDVWRGYQKTKDQAVRDRLITEYAHLVKYVAGKLSIHLGSHVEFEELVSNGIFGLIDAIDKFDVDKGVRFETYAGLRIRGAIIDSLRKQDWVPRSLRQKNKQLDRVFSEYESNLGRAPTDEEVSEALELPLSQAQDLMRKSTIMSLISLDEYVEKSPEGKSDVLGKEESPEDNIDKQELKKMLASAINNLSEKERTVVALYYYNDLTLKEISRVLGVTESRVSQIHSKAILRLRAALGKHRYILF